MNLIIVNSLFIIIIEHTFISIFIYILICFTNKYYIYIYIPNLNFNSISFNKGFMNSFVFNGVTDDVFIT